MSAKSIRSIVTQSAARKSDRPRSGSPRRGPVIAETSTAGDATPKVSVAILTPTGRDGAVASHILARFGIESKVCRNMEEICRLISDDGMGVILIAEEALRTSERSQLFDTLNQQPSWSDIPIILLTGEGELSSSLPRALSGVTEKGNVTLLERPVRVATLTTLIRSAQRARLRQLDVRDYIESRHKSEQSLRESEQRLRSAVLSAPYPLMLHAEGGEILQLSRAWTTLTGYDAGAMGTTGEWARLAFRGQAPEPQHLLSTRATSIGAFSTAMCPASIFAKLRMSLMSDSRCRWLRSMRSRSSRCSGVTAPRTPSERSCVYPAMALSGVRSSCDMVARNWLFAELASSACRLAARSLSTSCLYAVTSIAAVRLRR